MKTINLPAGSAKWIKSRSASKAAAMMGDDPKTSRTDLIRMMATGLGKEFTEWQQKNLLDKGNATEGGTRDIAEDVIGDGLSPACASTDDGYLTAAPDGITFDGRIGFEAKTWNEKLAAAVRAQELPKSHHWQLDQQILVFDLEYVLFCVSDGTRKNFVSMEYRSTPERAAKLLAGWKQLDEDVAAYTHVEAAPVATAAPINELPALMVEISGSVTASNLAQWKEIVTERIAGINTDLQTDQDFADADSMVKFLDDGEKRIDLVKSQAQANAADIDRVFRALDEIKASMRAKRLELDKLVTRRKESIKVEIMQAGKDALAAHIAGLNKRLAKVQMPPIAADFAAAIKGKRNLESMRGAVADLVAAKKIESDEIADRITINLQALHDGTRLPNADYSFLFSDYAQLILKAPDDLALVIKSRIQDHVVAEEKRLAEDREKIRAEEEARAAAKVKAEQEARDKIAAENLAAEKEFSARIATEAEANRAKRTEPAPLPAPDLPMGRLDETAGGAAQPGKPVITIDGPFTSDIQIPKLDDGARIRLGEISDRLGFTVTADFISSLGFHPVETVKAAKMYRESDFIPIVSSLIDRLDRVRAKDWRAAA